MNALIPLKKTLITLLILLIFQSTKATTWFAVSDGYWNSPAVWSTGVVPPYISTDTFKIQSHVIISSNLILNPTGQMTIDANGGICGHKKMICYSNTRVTKYGILQLDSMEVRGGVVNCYAPGQVIFSYNAFIVGSGSSFVINGCSLQVGGWFNCTQPEFAFQLAGINEQSSDAIAIYPNPSNGILKINLKEKKLKTIFVYNMLGDVLFQTNAANNSTFNIDISQASPGIYFVKALSDNGEVIVNMVVKE
jgi:hypothetical protein